MSDADRKPGNVAKSRFSSEIPRAMAAQTPLSNNTLRYVAVAQTLMRDIQRGKYQVGSMLPTESELCEQFQISRYTAREAIRQLKELGLVDKRAGVGTVVKAQDVNSRYVASISNPRELLAFTSQTRLELLSEDRAAVLDYWQGLTTQNDGQRWLRFSALRYLEYSRDPITFTQILVHPAYSAIREMIEDPGFTVFGMMQEVYHEHIAALRQDISSVGLSKEAADLLHKPVRSPGLKAVRYYLDDHDRLISIAVDIYPEGGHTLTTQWRLDWAAGQ